MVTKINTNMKELHTHTHTHNHVINIKKRIGKVKYKIS